MDIPQILTLADAAAIDVALTGGKGASLARMTQAGLPVPPGFVITSAAFACAVDQAELRAAMRAQDLERAQRLVMNASVPVDLIRQSCSDLAEPVAVRSSACAEDSLTASYAGQQETYLNVSGLDEVIASVRKCWASYFTDRAVFYRQQKGDLEDVDIAVVVQQMIDSHRSGVMFTADPVHHRRDRMVIEAAHGLGENVVNGEVTPDHYVLDRKGTIKRSTLRGDPILSADDALRLVDLGAQLETMYGHPQDIEWAIDAAGTVFLLQSRPITTV